MPLRAYFIAQDGSFRNRKTGMFWKEKQGWISWSGGRYHINPRRFMRRKFRPAWSKLPPFTFFPIMKEEFAMFWHEGNSEPFQLLKSAEAAPNPDETAYAIETFAKSTRLKRVLNPGTDWTTMLLVLEGFVILVLGIALASGQIFR